MSIRVTSQDTGIIESYNQLGPNPRLRMVKESARAYLDAQKAINQRGLWAMGVPKALTLAGIFMPVIGALVASGVKYVARWLFPGTDPTPSSWVVWLLIGFAALCFSAAVVIGIIGAIQRGGVSRAQAKAEREFGVTREYSLRLPADTEVPRKDLSKVAYLAMGQLTPRVRDRLHGLNHAAEFDVVQEALNMLMLHGEARYKAQLNEAPPAGSSQPETAEERAERERVALAAKNALGLPIEDSAVLHDHPSH